jgi:hypothetical protein
MLAVHAGCGKSTLLKAIAARDIPIPDHFDIYLLDREIPASDMTALEAVMSVDEVGVMRPGLTAIVAPCVEARAGRHACARSMDQLLWDGSGTTLIRSMIGGVVLLLRAL